MKSIQKSISLVLILTLVLTNLIGFVVPQKAEASYAGDLFFSEYIEGSSNNKAVEIFNGTGDSIDLSQYTVVQFNNGATQTPGDGYANYIELSGSLASGDVYVIANSGADQTILDQADNTGNGYFYGFNGNDVLVLFKNYDPDTRQGNIIDIIGTIGDDTYFAKDVTLVRKGNVTSGKAIYDANQWVKEAKDTFHFLGSHTMNDSSEPDTPKVASVMAEPPAGEVYAGTKVVLSTPTEDATILYSVYSEVYGFNAYYHSIEIHDDTTIWARASKDGMEDSDVSCFEYTVKDAPPVITIAEARQSDIDDLVAVEGIVTADLGSEIFIQDDTAGMVIYKSGLDLDVGDRVRAIGKFAEYYGLQEIKPANAWDVIVLEKNVEVIPESVASTDLNAFNGEVYEGKLVRIDHVFVDERDEYGDFRAQDTIGSFTINSSYVSSGQKYQQIIGVVKYHYGEYKIYTRNEDDVVDASGNDTYHTIEEARKEDIGASVKVHGIITHAESSTSIYIQDITAGIKIDTFGKDVHLNGYKVGDIIMVEGIIDQYKEELEIRVDDIDGITVHSRGHSLPEPKGITLSQLDDYQGQLVRIERVGLIDIESDDYSFLIEDETGTSKLYHNGAKNFDKNDYSANEYYNIVGIAARYESNQLKLRDGNDMKKLDIPPLVYRLAPANMAETFEKMPEISAKIEKTVYDIDRSGIKLTLDGNEVPYHFDEVEMVVHYTSPSELSIGRHDVRLEVPDIDGGMKMVEWYFNIGNKNAEYNFYFGVPHSHTAYSDGKGTPAEAFEHAYNLGLDFLIVTDHSNWFDGVKGEGNDPNYEFNEETNQYEEVEGSEWYNTRIQAEQFNAAHDDFLALRGFEMTSSSWGHSNVIDGVNYVEAKEQMTGMGEFYNWLQKQEGVVATFNHPGWPGDFNSLEYVPELDGIFAGIEVGNGAPPYSYTRFEEYYFKALDNGWHVGAMNAQDNHSNNWGEPDNLTVVISESLEHDAFMNALRNRRMYSTETRTLELTVKANEHWMGSVIDVNAGDEINFEIIAEDSDVAINKIQLISNGGNIIEEKEFDNVSRAEWYPSVTAGGGTQWYVVKVIHENGKWGTASPIFTPESQNDVKLNHVEVDPQPTLPGYETTLKTTVVNMGIRDVENIEVKFYEGTISEENLIGTVRKNKIKAGQTIELETVWIPEKSGSTTIIAKLSEIDGVTTVTEVRKMVDVIPSNRKTVLIDAAHANADVPGTVQNFMKLLRMYGYTVQFNTEIITEETLSGVDVLVVNTPSSQSNDFTEDEEKVIGNWVQGGGSILVASKSNYGNDSTLMNSLMASIGTSIRFNDDNVYEPENSDKYSGGMVWSVYAYNLPETVSGLNENMEAIRIFSGCSLVNANHQALVNHPDTGLEILLGGNDTSYNANPGKHAYVYNEEGSLNGETIPIIAKENVGQGKVIAAGRHFYSDFEIVNDVSNTALTLNLINWLADNDDIQTIQEVRETAEEGDIVTVKGTVTVPNETFFDVIYIQDETSGVCLYGNHQDKKDLPIGTEVIARGKVKYFEGELEIEFDEFEYQVLYVGQGTAKQPIRLSTGKSMSSEYTGMLVTTQGRITKYSEANSYFKINDGTGEAYIHVDGYVGAEMSRFKLGDYVAVTGIASVGAAGPRIRVRSKQDIILQNNPVSDDDDDDNNTSAVRRTKKKVEERETIYGKAKIEKNKDNKVKVTLEIDKAKFKKQIQANGHKKIIIEVFNNESASEKIVKMTADIIQEAAKAGKVLEINTGDAVMEINPEALELEKDVELEFKAEKIDEQTAETIFQHKKSKEYSPASEILDFKLMVSKGERQEKLEFKIPLNVSMKYDKANVVDPRKIGVYCFHEESNEWEFMGGKMATDGAIEVNLKQLGKYAVMEYDKKFIDVNMAWAKEQIEVLAAKHIVNGVDEMHYAPDEHITRAQFVKLLVEAFDLQPGEHQMYFTDVEKTAWYREYVEIATSRGLVTGYDGKFNPNANITREAMVTMILRVLKQVDSASDYVPADIAFADQQEISDWAKEAVATVYHKGLVKGLNATTFGPKENATRAQAAVIIYRMLEMLGQL